MTTLMTTLTVIFITASVTLFLFDRLDHPIIPAYLLAGIIAGQFIDSAQLFELSQLGIAFLVFVFGMRTEPERIYSELKEGTETTLAQLIGVGGIVFVVVLIYSQDLRNAFYLATFAALSSSLIGTELTHTENRVDMLHQRLSESIHFTQDLVAIGATIALTTQPFTIEAILQNWIVGAILILVAITFRALIFDDLVRLAEGSRELIMLIGLSVLLSFLAIVTITDTPVLVIGSFAAGLAVAKFPENLEMIDTMGSLKDFFAAIFFVTLGALATIPSPLAVFITLGLIGVTVIVKPAITVLILTIRGYDMRTAYLTGLNLDQISEFSLIIGIQAYLIGGLIHPTVFQSLILAAIVTMTMTAYTSRYAEPIYDYLSDHDILNTPNSQLMEKSNIPDELHKHTILIGFDVQGKNIAEKLKDLGEPFIIVENDPERISEAREHHEYHLYGDIMADETFDRLHLETADLVISTIPQEKASRQILAQADQKDTILRAPDPETAERLLDAGALYVSVPRYLAGERLREQLEKIIDNPSYRETLRNQSFEKLNEYLEREVF